MPTALRTHHQTVSRTDSPPECLRLGTDHPAAQQVVMVPGTLVPLVRFDLPKGLRGQAREQVAQRQLADRTGIRQGLTLHPCPPLDRKTKGRKTQGAHQWHQALIAENQLLEKLQDLSCQAVLPDYLTLPTAHEIWTLRRDNLPRAAQTDAPSFSTAGSQEEIVMARLGPDDGFTAQPALAQAQLERALSTGPAPRAWLLLSPQGEADPLIALAAAHDIPLVHDAADLADLGLPAPCVLQHGELACDLRRNPMAARNQLEQKLRPWRWPLLAGALAATVWAITQSLATARLEAETAAISHRTTQLVQEAFVPQGPVMDTRLQVNRALETLRRASSANRQISDPLTLTAQAAQVMVSAGQQPELLSYDESEGLLLGLKLGDFAAVDQLHSALDSAGLTVQLRDSRVSDGQDSVQAEFLITAPAPKPQTGSQTGARP